MAVATNSSADCPSGNADGVMTLLGSHTYDSGVTYAGEWAVAAQDGVTCFRQGLGRMNFPDGARYVGLFDGGLSTGPGVIWFPDGSRYEGEFLKGWFHGHGIFQRRDGTLYEGEFRGGRIWGNGLLTFSDGSHGFPHHEGYFQDCKFMRKGSCEETVVQARGVAAVARALTNRSLGGESVEPTMDQSHDN